MFPSGANDKGAEREPGPLNFLRPRMRIGVDRFQSTGAGVGINFGCDDARVAEQSLNDSQVGAVL